VVVRIESAFSLIVLLLLVFVVVVIVVVLVVVMAIATTGVIERQHDVACSARGCVWLDWTDGDRETQSALGNQQQRAVVFAAAEKIWHDASLLVVVLFDSFVWLCLPPTHSLVASLTHPRLKQDGLSSSLKMIVSLRWHQSWFVG
jgi:hypothetical protein